MKKINPSEITPEGVYLSRRKFMVGVGAAIASSLLLNACGRPDPTLAPASPEVSTTPSPT